MLEEQSPFNYLEQLVLRTHVINVAMGFTGVDQIGEQAILTAWLSLAWLHYE